MVVFNLNIKTGWLMHLDALGNLWGAQLRSDEEGWWMLDPMGDWGTTRCCGDHRMHKIAKKKKNNFMNITNCELFVCQKLQVICYYHHLQLLHLQEWKDRFERLQERFPMLSTLDQMHRWGRGDDAVGERGGLGARDHGCLTCLYWYSLKKKVRQWQNHRGRQRTQRKDMFGAKGIRERVVHEGHLKLVARNLGNYLCLSCWRVVYDACKTIMMMRSWSSWWKSQWRSQSQFWSSKVQPKSYRSFVHIKAAPAGVWNK